LGNRESGDKIESEWAKSRDFRACEAQVANYRRTQDWVAGDAVLIAPVSTQISLLTGNFTGNFADSAAWEALSTQEVAAPQRLLPYFPTEINRENISPNREISNGIREAGKMLESSKPRSPAHPRLSLELRAPCSILQQKGSGQA
jgi:hypothetical protein